MLKLYTKKEFLTETYRRQVFPLLFDLVFLNNKTLLEHYRIVDTVSDADIVVFPVDYGMFLKQNAAFISLLQLAKQHQKPIWIYTAGDYGFSTYIANSYTFRLGGFDSKLDRTTNIIPSFINDPYAVYLPNGFLPLKKENKPSIGFVGHAQSGLLKYFKEYTNHLKYQVKRILNRLLADKQSFYPSSIKRANYLSKLASKDSLKTEFILRNKYRAGSHTVQTQKESTQQFYDNIFNNAYTFCSRGVGNFSVRFYEALAVGRIPILLNTDCRLPLHNSMDWSKHILILDETKVESIEEQILQFHNSLSDSEFENIQKSNRELWLTTLRRDVYYIEIAKQFKKIKQ
ncbi:exostosin domain-containing protein [Algibacter pacificus]|uniref:exostosin domain-containing protein n=1 Tax=Algibacter pacificus TaxID=2599389 RepID=UPI0011C9F80A|nr:exostosin family protein [Algibacter pacificus]